MRLSDGKSIKYEKNQLAEVICQLRFPTILSIEAKEPADFQDEIRDAFPRYMMQVESVPQRGDGRQETAKNHMFISENGKYKLSLTKNFIALSTLSYSSWRDFAGWLDKPLGNFISIYKPAFFERVGLRYVNAFSRSRLDLASCPWRELIMPEYLGMLSREELDEGKLVSLSQNVELSLDDRCRLKLHAGPGHIKRSVKTGDAVKTVQEKETRFIFDQDIFAGGSIRLGEAAELMEKLHSHADSLFSGAITDKLHDAMEPVYIP